MKIAIAKRNPSSEFPQSVDALDSGLSVGTWLTDPEAIAVVLEQDPVVASMEATGFDVGASLGGLDNVLVVAISEDQPFQEPTWQGLSVSRKDFKEAISKTESRFARRMSIPSSSLDEDAWWIGDDGEEQH